LKINFWKLSNFRIYLDTSRSALGDSIRHSSTRRINHGHETNESESRGGEVGVLSVELEAHGVLVRGQQEVAETEHTLSQTAELEVGVVESLLHFLVENLFLAVDEDGVAAVEDTFRGALHDQNLAGVVGVLVLVDGHLELVGRVEGNFAGLLVALADAHDVTKGQLHALQKGSLRSITVNLSKKWRKKSK
jgi:hypothetical protein